MTQIAKLEEVPLRDLWKHEERGFSAWLAENLDELAESIAVPLQNPEREMDAGDFAVDIVAESEQGERVVIENQLGTSDHGHLGKLVTYLSNLDAKAAIWIVSEPRPEHIRALQWLNETSPDDTAFYLVKLAAYRIAGSDPAPLFTVIVGPSEESKDFGKQKKELAERHVLRKEFWAALLERAKAHGILYHAQRSPSKDSWLSAGAGIRSGVSLNYNIWMDSAAVDVWISTEDPEVNKRLFDSLHNQRGEIERLFGGQLTWDRLDEKRASRVRANINLGGLLEEKTRWIAIQDAMIDAMDRLAKSVKPALEKVTT